MKILVRIGTMLALTAALAAAAGLPAFNLPGRNAGKAELTAQANSGPTAGQTLAGQRRSLPATGVSKKLHSNGKAWLRPASAKGQNSKAIILTVCSQDFESDWTGWTAVNGNGDAVVWKVGTTTDLGAYKPPSYGTQFAYYSDDDAGSGALNTNEEWISPAFFIPDTTPAVTQLDLTYGWGFRISGAGQRLHTLARAFSGAGWSGWDTLVSYTGTGNGTEALDISGYLPSDSLQLKWVYEDINATEHWGYGGAIDNVVVTASPLTYDAKPLALANPDPSNFLNPLAGIIPAVVVRSAGTDSITNVSVTLRIDSAGVNIYDQTVFVDTLPGMDTAWVSFSVWTTGPAGSYSYGYTVFTSYVQDEDPGNDTISGQLQSFAEVSTVNSPYTSVVPVYDGVIDTVSEWNDAVKVDISNLYGFYSPVMAPGSAHMYLKNDGDNLYVAVDAMFDSTLSASDQIGLYLEDNHNHDWEQYPDTTEGNYWIGLFGSDTMQTRYLCAGPSSGMPRYRDGLTPVAYSLTSGRMQYEIAVPFGSQTDPAYLKACPGSTIGFWMYAMDNSYYGQAGWWPQSATWNDPLTYASVILGASGLPDAGIMDLRAPKGIVPVDSAVIPSVKVGNFGAASASFSVTCVIDTNGAPVYSKIQNVTGLGSMDTLPVLFPSWAPETAGTYNVTMYVTYGADTYPANDTVSTSVISYEKNLNVSSPYTTVIPAFDGAIDTAEWNDAVRVDISDIYGMSGTPMAPGSGYMYLKNDGDNLYVAVDAILDTSYSSNDGFYLLFDDNHNRAWETYPDTTEGYYMIGNYGADSIYTTYICPGPSFGSTRIRDGMTPVGFSNASGRMQYEAAIPLGKQVDPAYLNAFPGGSIGLWMFAVDGPSGYTGWWPQSYVMSMALDPAGFGIVTLGASGKPDASMMAIRRPGSAEIMDSAFAPTAKVANFCSLATDFSVFCVIDTNGTPVYSDSQSVAGLGYMDTLLVPFTTWTPDTPMTYNVTMYVRYIGDTNPDNDTLTATFMVARHFWLSWEPFPVPATATSAAGHKEKLYVFGGYYGTTTGTEDRIMIYDPASGSWTQSPASLSDPTYWSSAVAARGKIFVLGGYDEIANLDCYSPQGDSLNPRADMPNGGYGFAAGVWRDSIIYRLGGYGASGLMNTVALYDIASDTWDTSATPLPTPVYFGCAAILGDTIVFSTGNNTSGLTDSTYLGLIDPANPDSITWSTGPNYPGGALYGAAYGYIGNPGQHGLMIAGGAGSSLLATTYSYTTADGWTQWPDKTSPGYWTGGAQAGNYFAVAGNYDGGAFYSCNEALYLGPEYATGVSEEPVRTDLTPARLCLLPSRPNPASRRTVISYQLPVRCQAWLTVYNIMGQRVRTLASGTQEAGFHQVTWNCDDQSGRKVAAGVYFYNLRTEKGSATKKLLIVR